MKEYQTLRVDPNDESAMIEYMESFGWKVEESREIYNESQEVVGQTYRENNSFMKGYTGNDGTVTVQTRTNVTHYISIRFSRDTNASYYARIKSLQDEFENLENVQHVIVPEKPIMLTFLAVIGFPTIILPIMAIVSWKRYPKRKEEAEKYNAEADEKNQRMKERRSQIMVEAERLLRQADNG